MIKRGDKLTKSAYIHAYIQVLSIVISDTKDIIESIPRDLHNQGGVWSIILTRINHWARSIKIIWEFLLVPIKKLTSPLKSLLNGYMAGSHGHNS